MRRPLIRGSARSGRVPIEIDSRPKGPIIPDQCTIELSGRLVPGQNPERLIADLQETVDLSGGFQTEVVLERHHYPAKVVNRVVDWWVNKIRPRPAA